MERPKRNALKKLDDDFVSAPHSHASSSVGDEHQHDKRTSLDNSAVHSSAGKVKSSKVGRLSAPLPRSPKTPVTGLVSAKGSAKKMPGETTETPLKSGDVDEGSGKRAGRACDKASCVRAGLKPRCFAGAAQRCAGSGWTSRWYHVSFGEHYCNDCFDNFYRSTKDGYKIYFKWKRTWSSNAKAEANVKLFLVDQYLPFWVQCTSCGRWRQLPKETSLSPDLIRSYKCDASIEKGGQQGCDVPEDPCVQGVTDPSWINMLMAPPYMCSSPAAPFLVNYRPDSVGLSASLHQWRGRRNRSAKRQKTENGVESPSSSDDEDKTESPMAPASGPMTPPCVAGLTEILEPFLQPNSEPFALALLADKMTDDEQQHFPQYAKEQVMYLAIRNTVLALWSLHPKEVLTAAQCIPHIICRGLSRIRCVHELPAIIQYLSLRHYINGGIICGQIRDLYPADTFRGKVVVIGAGPAGLGAAHQLTKLGAEVVVVESRDRVGGRVCDDSVNGSVVGRGAQLINGCVNNPFALICHQLDIPLTEVSDRCWLVNESGKLVDLDTDSKLDFHFDEMLDKVAEWKKQAAQDSSLLERLLNAHATWLSDGATSFTPEEEQLFQFHMANLENACGASLKHVSAFHWDHNEVFAQFGGPLCVLPRGLATLMDHLAKGIDIRLSKQVKAVNMAGSDKGCVEVVTDDETFTADCVLVTLPLAILRQNTVAFSPPLPPSKLQAIKNLGVGVMEKVALYFDHCFWATKFPDAQFFGCVPGKQDMRGLFSVFHAVTTRIPEENQKKTGGALVAFLSGEAANIIFEKSDEEIVSMCVDSLRKVFPEEETIKPSKYFVTRWQSDPYASMSYSYVPVGCTADAYDDMAEPVNSKIFFAGEATNRMHPQTVTGAYLSGIREVCRMLELQ